MLLKLSISPRYVFRLLCVVITLLTIMSTLAITALYFYRWPQGSPQFNAVKIFWLDTEGNLPTLYQSFTLMLSAGLLAWIAAIVGSADEKYTLHWKVMAALFLYMGIDEGAHIHEVIEGLLAQSLQGNTLMQYPILEIAPWVILGILIFAFAYVQFLLHLPRRIGWMLFLSGATYVGGALGVEMLGLQFAAVHGKGNAVYAGLATIEEFMEMISIAIFIYALLDYLHNRIAEIRIHF